MNDVNFDENNEFYLKTRVALVDKKTSPIIKLLIKSGIAKNQKQALMILVGVLFFLIISIFYVYFQFIKKPNFDYVIAPDGTRYGAEEYLRLIKMGKDPLIEK